MFPALPWSSGTAICAVITNESGILGTSTKLVLPSQYTPLGG